MQKKQVIFISSGLAMLALILLAAPTLAATNKNFGGAKGLVGRLANFSHKKETPAVKPAMIGNITAISGSILTVTGENKTTYTIDATNAKITQGFGANATTLAISNLTVGETIFANGTVSGTNVTATTVSVMNNADKTRVGQPGDFRGNRGVSGNVTAVNGSSFTVQRTGRMPDEKIATSTIQNVFYTVNTTGSTVFKKDGQAATLADVVQSERVMVTGTIDATTNTVTATAVNIVTKQPVESQHIDRTKTVSQKVGHASSSLLSKFKDFFKKK
jgi:hypothetical protein